LPIAILTVRYRESHTIKANNSPITTGLTEKITIQIASFLKLKSSRFIFSSFPQATSLSKKTG